MNEMMEEYKKSDHYKKKKRTNALLVFIFLLILASLFLYYIYSGLKSKEQSYSYKIRHNVVTLSKYGKKINSYNCNSDCDIYLKYFRYGKILLNDGGKYYLYDLVKNERLTDDLNNVFFIYSSSIEKIENVNYIVGEDYNGKWGIVDLSGNNIVPFEYDELGKVIDGRLYNYLYNYYYITATKDGKIGVLSIPDNILLIKPLYEDILLFNNERVSVKDNDWKLVNIHNIQLLEETFDSLFVLKDSILVTKNNYFYLIDFKGNEISNKQEMIYNVDYWERTGLTYKYNRNGNLEVTTENNEVYEYNNNTARFTKK